MLRIAFDEPVPCLGQTIPAGDYRIETASTGIITNCTVPTLIQQEDLPVFDANKDYNGGTIGVVRPGGLGDLLFMTPLFRAMKQKWPEATIKLYVMEYFKHAIFPNNIGVEVCQYPIPTADFEKLDGVFWPENIIERNKRAQEIHAVDLFAEAAGVELTDGKMMSYFVTEQEQTWAAEHFPRKPNTPRIGVQVAASAFCRSYLGAHTGKVLDALLKDGMELFLFGEPGRISAEESERVVNFSKRKTPFRYSVAALNTCDAVLGPDSVITHLGGIFGIPTVALYGPFPWQLRTKYAPSIRALQGHAPCAPCFHHARPGSEWPKGMQCERDGFCSAMASIPPERVYAEVRKAIQRPRLRFA